MTPSFLENHISQIPALQLLVKMGYRYLPPAEALRLRGGKLSNVLLDEVLETQLRKINTINYKGKIYQFSEDNIQKAIRLLRDYPRDVGLVQQSEWLYNLLNLGESFKENLDGNLTSPQLQFIDWNNPQNNVFHVTDEFSVSCENTASLKGAQTRRPDIVLFVNGIPLVVIECKRPDDKDWARKAIDKQFLRNQKPGEIPSLFAYSQLLLAINKNEARYATTKTPYSFWAKWREKSMPEVDIDQLVNRPMETADKQQLFASNYAYTRKYFDQLEAEGDRLPTSQDNTLISLCSPERLLDIIRGYIIFDAGVKKIARYQQYFAVKKILQRVQDRDNGSQRRQGGVIWHTQGSGKSLTMVMTAKNLAMMPGLLNSRVVLVTDRVDLDEQIKKTFKHCGLEPVQAKTGKHLLELIDSDTPVITSLINKFAAAIKKTDFKNEDDNIFVLVDEGHRSQYGEANIAMQRILPNACYLGFTGTPLMKQDKNTAQRFGGLIDSYTINEAVEDKAVVRLLYESRLAEQDVNTTAIDKWFNVVSEGLEEKQKADLKRKFSSTGQLNKVRGTIKEIALDISQHYKKNWSGTPYKAQLTAPSKLAALQYHEFLQELGLVSSAVLISGPSESEGEGESNYKAGQKEIETFWEEMMDRYGNEREYNKQLIAKFQHSPHPQIIIVVDKLLTGFDAPNNTVLYITRPLKEHTLLQAIARVNRIADGKDFGYIVDYYGVLKQLNEAMDLYGSFSDYDAADIEGALIDISEELKALPQHHSALLDIFKTLPNKQDEEAYEQHLADEDIRKDFYDALNQYHRCLAVALSSFKFSTDTKPELIDRYKGDLAFYLKLRAAVKIRYAEAIDFSEYESKVQKLLHEHVTSHEVIQITEPVDIFDTQAFEEEVDKQITPAAKADTIAHRTKRTITERMEEDPTFYRKFSKILEEAIAAFRQKRISDTEYLAKVKDAYKQVLHKGKDQLPPDLPSTASAGPIFNTIQDTLNGAELETDKLVSAVTEIDERLIALAIVNFTNNPDIQKAMFNVVDDVLYQLNDDNGLDLTTEQMDRVCHECVTIMKSHHA
ncbi:type I restriction enzyme, R subunit [Rubritalea squalenifaciens DSM 18772]|uniref:Type I restriction enzyme endonuclease subunit n=1 Tax=Rubritalea squalenifaciens DSM 18772 TaxID=1123071 RepID=A0A1M6GUR4_9BACT|nr:type I restriction endonuclease subunit R [Rubritalea squalenifaciens]SHJ13692.1 type I restriction enzyme, R subunit [Rubritalea squalenifaciens DSM 18772]